MRAMSSDEVLQLYVIDDRLWPTTFGHPEGNQAIELVAPGSCQLSKILSFKFLIIYNFKVIISYWFILYLK